MMRKPTVQEIVLLVVLWLFFADIVALRYRLHSSRALLQETLGVLHEANAALVRCAGGRKS